MTPKILLAAILLLMTGYLTACNQPESTNLKKDIVGKWSCDSGKTILDISDGKFVFSSETNGIKINGNSGGATFLDDTHILGFWELDLPSYEVHIRGNKMILKKNGHEMKCSK